MTRVNGFYSMWNMWQYAFKPVDFSKLTSISCAFILPLRDGSLDTSFIDNLLHSFKALKEDARSSSVKVIVSIGGVDSGECFSSATRPENIDKFVNNIYDFVTKYDVDGIDIDWEYVTEDTQEQYILLLKKLNKKFKQGKFILTTDIPGSANYYGKFYDPIITYLCDWVNVMTYDYTGDFEWSDKRHHSEFSDVALNIKRYIDKGFDSDDLTMGIPFYGIDFTHDNVKHIAYKDIESSDTHFDDEDDLITKVQFAKDYNLGGYMIWELNQDNHQSYLLNTISEFIS